MGTVGSKDQTIKPSGILRPSLCLPSEILWVFINQEGKKIEMSQGIFQAYDENEKRSMVGRFPRYEAIR